MRSQIVCLIIVLLSGGGAVAAGQEKGGGLGISLQGQVFLYDFIESGLETRAVAFSGRDYPDQWNLVDRMTALFSDRGDERMGRDILSKLYEISEKSPRLGRYLYEEFFQSYSIFFVNSQLVKTNDMGPTPILPIDKGTLVQIAVRDDELKTVWIDRDLWRMMPRNNKIGLIFHEALYALNCQLVGPSQRRAADTRAIVSRIFSPEFAYENPKEFTSFLNIFFGGKMSDDKELNQALL